MNIFFCHLICVYTSHKKNIIHLKILLNIYFNLFFHEFFRNVKITMSCFQIKTQTISLIFSIQWLSCVYIPLPWSQGNVLASSNDGSWLDPRTSHINGFLIGTYCLFTQHVVFENIMWRLVSSGSECAR